MPAFLLTLLAAAYGAPSDFDAREAIGRRYKEAAAEKTLSLYQYTIESEPHYPADVRVARCVRVEAGDVDGRADGQLLVGAMSCIVEVIPNIDPPFVTIGVFAHDSYSWRYYGPLSQVDVAGYDDLVKTGAEGRFQAKPGSEIYDGDQLSSPNDGARSQYESILDSFGMGPDR